MIKRIFVAILLFTSMFAAAQNVQVTSVNYGAGNIVKETSGTGAPTSACSGLMKYTQTDAVAGQNFWLCINGTMVQQVGTVQTATTIESLLGAYYDTPAQVTSALSPYMLSSGFTASAIETLLGSSEYDAYGAASTAQTNAESYSSNANNLGSGTIPAGRLANAISPTVPAWLQYLGTGADGAETCGTIASGDYYFTTFTVSSSCSVTNPPTGLVIHATGACTINGTITVTQSAGGLMGGGAAGGSGGGTAAAATGVSTYGLAVSGRAASTVGTTGGASGGSGGSASAVSTTAQRNIFDSGGGTDGQYLGGGISTSGGSSGGSAAQGGGGVVLICGSITGTGTINVSGVNGNNAPGNNTGASAGGGGGVVILSSQAAETFGITINVAAGTGGSCLSYTGCGTPGTSAAGWSAEVSGW